MNVYYEYLLYNKMQNSNKILFLTDPNNVSLFVQQDFANEWTTITGAAMNFHK